MQRQAACEAAASAEAAAEKLRAKLQASQAEVQLLNERLSSLLAERQQQQCVQQVQACPLHAWSTPNLSQANMPGVAFKSCFWILWEGCVLNLMIEVLMSFAYDLTSTHFSPLPAELSLLKVSYPDQDMQVQAELSKAQEALKAARSESTRRLRELQQLQSQQAAAAADSGLKHQLEAETAAKEAAQEKLRDSRASLARHKQLVSELRCKVGTC